MLSKGPLTLRKFRKCSSSILKDITSAKATNWRENRAKPKQTLNSYTILDTVYDSNPLPKKYYNPGGCESGGAGLIKTPLCSSKKKWQTVIFVSPQSPRSPCHFCFQTGQWAEVTWRPVIGRCGQAWSESVTVLYDHPFPPPLPPPAPTKKLINITIISKFKKIKKQNKQQLIFPPSPQNKISD